MRECPKISLTGGGWLAQPVLCLVAGGLVRRSSARLNVLTRCWRAMHGGRRGRAPTPCPQHAHAFILASPSDEIWCFFAPSPSQKRTIQIRFCFLNQDRLLECNTALSSSKTGVHRPRAAPWESRTFDPSFAPRRPAQRRKSADSFHCIFDGRNKSLESVKNERQNKYS